MTDGSRMIMSVPQPIVDNVEKQITNRRSNGSVPEIQNSKRRKDSADAASCSTSTFSAQTIGTHNEIQANSVPSSVLTLHPCILLPQILLRIFELLPLDSRRSVRLTNKVWYDCCTHVSLTSREKFVFREGCTMSEIADFLLNTNLVQISVEFQCLSVHLFLSDVWQKCGHRVKHLHFNHCYLASNIFRDIMSYCVNLESISFDGRFFYGPHCRGTFSLVSWLNDELVYFIEAGIERPQLLTLEMIAGEMNANLLRKIISVFPGIKHFRFGEWTEINSPRDDRSCSESPLQLESLTLSADSGSNASKFWLEEITTTWHLERLTKLELNLENSSLKESDKRILLQFFTAQTNLRNIYLRTDFDQIFFKKLTFHILEQCGNLRSFDYGDHKAFENYGSKILLTHTEIQRFMELISKLHRLTMLRSYFRVENLPPVSPKHFSMEVLSTNMQIVFQPHDTFCKYLLKHCSNLRHLELLHCSNDILQEIFENMLDLRTLVLKNVSGCSSFAFFGRDMFNEMKEGFSIKRLQKLEFLEIRSKFNFHVGFVQELIQESKFLKLKCLKLYIPGKVSHSRMMQLVSDSVNLEVLDTPSYQARRFEHITELCNLLKNLKFVTVASASFPSFKSGNFERIFKTCPNLRFVSHDRMKIFWYDHQKKCINTSKRDHFRFSGLESVFSRR